jgi:hypothetical protein
MSEPDPDEELTKQATEFAESLTRTVRDVLGPHEPAFEAVYETGKAGSVRLVVRPQTPEGGPAPSIPVRIKDHIRLELKVQIWCSWDRDREFLAVDESKVAVRMVGKAEPLYRWEYIRAPESNVPSAHFHAHAHRDEAVYLLMCGEGNRRADERAAQIDASKPRIPQVSDLHLPLGGPRFRPCLEDVLQFLIEEFCIDCQDNWKQAIEEGRRTWRRLQTGTVVRDCPQEAARALELMGYKIEPPDPPPAESPKLSMY